MLLLQYVKKLSAGIAELLVNTCLPFQFILNRIRYDLERDVYICQERCVTETNNGCEVNALLFD